MRVACVAAALLAAVAVAGCSSGPDKASFVREMTSKASKGFTAESFWSCVYDKTDADTRSRLMDLQFSAKGGSDAELSRRVSKVMGECLGFDLSRPTSTTPSTTAPSTAAPTTMAPGSPSASSPASADPPMSAPPSAVPPAPVPTAVPGAAAGHPR
jgi:hypothetical protein